MKEFNTILQLRRDNDYNYEKVKNTFVPKKGEICLVDTARSGLRAVCGDGQTLFGELDFMDNLFVKGYIKDSFFYKDAEATVLCETNTNILYIDIPTSSIYYFTGIEYQELGRSMIPTATMATDTTPGIMKLYSTTGQNEDGTMTQKAISDELDDKVEVTLNIEEELIIFTND
jgi:hypothetical protein